MIIKIIEDSKKAREFSAKIYEVINSGYGNSKDDLCRIGRIISASGDVKLKDIQDLQSALSDSKAFAEEIENLLREVGYAA